VTKPILIAVLAGALLAAGSCTVLVHDATTALNGSGGQSRQ
jgi:hypothetical protein